MPAGQHSPQLQSKVSQVAPQHGQDWALDTICRLLKTDVDTANHHFCEQAQKASKEAKIMWKSRFFFTVSLSSQRQSLVLFARERYVLPVQSVHGYVWKDAHAWVPWKAVPELGVASYAESGPTTVMAQCRDLGYDIMLCRGRLIPVLDR